MDKKAQYSRSDLLIWYLLSIFVVLMMIFTLYTFNIFNEDDTDIDTVVVEETPDVDIEIVNENNSIVNETELTPDS